MMNWFMPKLEPGERVLASDPPGWLRRVAVAGAVLLAGVMAGMPLAGFARVGDRLDSLMLVIGLVGGAMALYAVAGLGRWRLTITDRRILARKIFFSPGQQEIRRDQVEEVDFRPMSLSFHGADEFVISTGPAAFLLQREAIRVAFETGWDKEPAPQPTAPALEPGETVLARSRPDYWIFAVQGLMLTALIGLFVSLGIERLFADPLSLFPLAAGFLFMILFYAIQILPHFLYRRERWTVTDRRIIARRGLWRPEYRQIRLAAIDGAEWSSGQLVLRAGEDRLTILGAAIPAELLARLLPRWFPDAGQPMARLGRILQPGEKVLFRDGAVLSSWTMLFFFLLAAAIVLPGFIEDLAAGEWGKALIWLVFPAFMLSTWTTNPLRGKGWQTAVTDRRLLVRMERDDSRYEEFPLAELEDEHPGSPTEILTLRHGERIFPIHPGSAKKGKHILDAIRNAKGEA
ncbi:MAG: hypothetical protein OEZ03_13015 [Alphaproteobacteria bacterium]|nr:hypothetical protein [Alphaproteobacteria bacterium]